MIYGLKWPRTVNCQYIGTSYQALQQANPVHQLWPIVLHVADVGPDLPGLDRASVGLHQLSIKIGSLHRQRAQRLDRVSVAPGPVEAGSGRQLDLPVIQPRVHAVAVVFDFVEPLIAVRRRIDQLG